MSGRLSSMALPPGTRLGPHEILAPLGAGGMGEVYRARDTRLGRDVAIKVLPADVSADPARLRRFEQEARAAAALNHSNILAVYDIGHEGERAYIVTELLDGRTLREVLANETLTLSRVIDLASQIADGLAAAHSRNIVHRDLKPENILVTDDGRAKILDFGLAKTIESEADAASSPTRSATAPHTVLGTAGYMAPEQARAQPVDHRADVFAFGAVLYEIVTGRRAFGGDTALDRMTAILREAPAPIVSTAARPLPPALVRIIDRCLEKSPAARFQSTTDLAFALKSVSHGDTVTGISPAERTDNAASSRARWNWLPWAIAAVAVAGSLLAWIPARRLPEVAVSANHRHTIGPPPGEVFGANLVSPQPAVSPNGQLLLFNLDPKPPRQINEMWVHSFEDGISRSLNVSGAQPFWSPDSRSIGFLQDGRLKAIDLDNRMTRTICDVMTGGDAGFGGGSWSHAGVIVFGGGGSNGNVIQQVDARGGKPSPVTSLDAAAKHTNHRNPFFLPDGRRFLYQSLPDQGIWLGSLDGAPPKFLLIADSKAQYAPPGWLLYVKDNALYAQRFDLDREELLGGAYLLALDVRTNEGNGRSGFSVSTNGVLVYRTGDEDAARPLVWLDRAGNELGAVPDSTARYADLELVDLRRAIAAILEVGQRADLHSIDLETGRLTRLTSNPGLDDLPVISYGREEVAYYSDQSQPPTVFRRPLSGGGSNRVWPGVLCDADNPAAPTDWSKTWLIYMCGGFRKNDLWMMRIDGSVPPRTFLNSIADEAFGRLSPDEHWIVYQSNEAGSTGIYLRAFPDAGQQQSVSGSAGGTDPQWRADGAEILYREQGRPGSVMAVSFERTQAEPKLGPPRRLEWPVGGGYPIGIAPDGTRALVPKPRSKPTQDTPLTVHSNWLQLIGKR